MTDLSSLLLAPAETLRAAMIRINETGAGIVLIVDDDRRLLFTLTDGDIRRAILDNLSLDLTVAAWAARRTERGNKRPTTAPAGTPTHELLRLMDEEGIQHVPLVDARHRVVALARQDELLPGLSLGVDAVLMAGGEGQRLRPLTRSVPKPMLPVAGRPLIEHIVSQLRAAGIRQVSIATNYLAEHIAEHFGDGERFGLHIDYLQEDQPLGTAGALELLAPWTSTLLVVNGDILTRLSYPAMLAFHRETRATMTMAVRQYDVQVPYGVVETNGIEVQRIKEKPVLPLFVNAGIYLLEPRVRTYLVPERLDMPDLIARLLAGGERVVSFPISEYWLDIGQYEDYARAQRDGYDGPTSS